MVGLAAQDIDRAACLIAVVVLIGEQRPGDGIGDPPSRLVVVKRPLKRAHEQIALGAVVEDDAQAGVACGPAAFVNTSPTSAT